MCHFLTISIPAANVPEVPEHLRRKVNFTKQINQSIAMHTPPGWTSFVATSGGCSCDLFRAADKSPEDEAKLVSKYRKKGWSEGKIRRVVESRATATTRSAGLRDDIKEMVADFARAFGHIRLSLHWYSRDPETENFSLKDSGEILLEDFRRDPTALEDETTLTIRNPEHDGGLKGPRP